MDKTTSVLTGELSDYLSRLFPICRSLSGSGNRETLAVLQEIIPLQIKEYRSLEKVFDWQIPPEWNIRDAWIKNSAGEKIVDFKKNNLHVVGYSVPVRAEIEFNDLVQRLHMLPQQPEAVPYRTSYYSRDWGFCVTQSQFRNLEAATGPLSVCIDSSLDQEGSMTIGELRIPGRSDTEFIMSTYICHPSMANDNLSGILITAFLARMMINKGETNYSWRFVFVPETIGAIAYLSHNEQNIRNIIGGFVVSCCGGPGPFGYKPTFLGNHLIDRACSMVFKENAIEPICFPFVPTGSDERQYSSPGFRIPVGTISKDKYYEYPEYHTSLDNLDFVTGENLEKSYRIYADVIRMLDSNYRITSRFGKGEVNLGRRGLYPSLGGAVNPSSAESVSENRSNSAVRDREIDIINWLLFSADGKNDLLSVAESSGYCFKDISTVAKRLRSAGLIDGGFS